MFISISRILLISSARVVGLATPTKHTSAQIQADLKVFGTELTDLDSVCKALSLDSTTAQVLAIAPIAGTVSASLKKGLTTVIICADYSGLVSFLYLITFRKTPPNSLHPIPLRLRSSWPTRPAWERCSPQRWTHIRARREMDAQ
ncbi:hypothetical protein B0H17DRAFT_1207473 [Mycena rosella]|uniref:Uncharacterized protein n=1 Tax=Mycena rosella TaxID=1033263 RepID=A0AAD7D6K6_MYCRO|nr:hypothetical protein B0H17DRAFT_1207473 [Mycena rosella]